MSVSHASWSKFVTSSHANKNVSDFIYKNNKCDSFKSLLIEVNQKLTDEQIKHERTPNYLVAILNDVIGICGAGKHSYLENDSELHGTAQEVISKLSRYVS
ncbi:MAG: hypothetical protein RLZZ210_1634 [Pseudomonadota bacterium]|jgi:hypothetical protein